MIPLNEIGLGLVALGAALVNGAVGYGFSSIVTPIAILWYSNKVLNPALVIVEVAVNLALLTRERKYARLTWPRARPVILTLLPGIILGTAGLTYLAVNDVKVLVYVVLFPLVILQLLGFSRPFQNERRGGAAIGSGIGFLYALTTISGPPLALFLRNQGLSKNEFRCTIAQIRVAESTLTLGTYLAFDQFLGAGLVKLPSLDLLPLLFVAVLVGVPLGTLLLRSVSPEFFRRFVMGVDGLVISYGLSRVLVSLKWISNAAGEYLLATLFLLIGALAWFALRRLPVHASGEPPPRPPGQPPTSAPGVRPSLGAGPPPGPLT
ncbi:MAG: sulfite exporter TauE/SafE family protein [Thermoplasmata archaeon]